MKFIIRTLTFALFILVGLPEEFIEWSWIRCQIQRLLRMGRKP